MGWVASGSISVDKYKDQVLWPGFRVAKFKRLKGSNIIDVDILEPGRLPIECLDVEL
jgi:hypothetical protein